MLAPALLAVARGPAHAQTTGHTEFEVASIKTNAPQTGFHFAANLVSGGPGTADPNMFRCSQCSLGTLIVQAFSLQPYQFPGRTSLTDNTYDIMAKIPEGATRDQFSAMLQNLLKDRFRLTWHFQEKMMKGYHLVVAKSGPKLSESTGASLPPAADQQHFGQGESHNHTGVIAFGSSATYRAASRTAADLARVLSDQLGLPVDDETGLPGKYDISLRWSGNVSAHTENRSDGHAGHDGGGAPFGGPVADSSGPALFDAIQQQLGLRLIPAEQAVARLFVIDHVAQRPTEN